MRAASRDGGDFVETPLLQFVREFDDEDGVFRNQADERDEPDLRVNVHRRRPAVGEEGHVRARHFQEGENERAEHGQRDGAEEDDERIAEAVELRREDEKDEDEGEAEGGQEFVAFDAELARFAGVIDRVTFRQNLAPLRLPEA